MATFRFLHAADFHLERPIADLVEIPEPLRELLIDAPYSAALRVFDTAVREKVDFVVLSGDLFDIDTGGARALSFLLEQFERLNGQEIAVYWSGGEVDGLADWPAGAPLPKGVQLFPVYQAEEFSHFRGERAVATLRGRSWQSGPLHSAEAIAPDFDRLFTVVVTYGKWEIAKLLARPVSYWALGGEHNRQTFGDAQRTVHYPGATQGRSLSESGPHGCTLVTVSDDHRSTLQFIPTDSVRWAEVNLEIDEAAVLLELKRLFTEQIKTLRQESDDRPLLVQWNLSPAGAPTTLANRARLQEELLAWLRADFGGGRAPLWSLAVSFTAAEMPAAWSREETMLGEFLRAARTWEEREDDALELLSAAPERYRTTAVAQIADVSDPVLRRQLLRDAAQLGARLLGADERSLHS